VKRELTRVKLRWGLHGKEEKKIQKKRVGEFPRRFQTEEKRLGGSKKTSAAKRRDEEGWNIVRRKEESRILPGYGLFHEKKGQKNFLPSKGKERAQT